MKKMFFAFISLLCMTVPALADKVTDLAQLSNEKVYTLTSERAFLLHSANVAGEISSSTGTAVGTVKKDSSDPNQQFKIEKLNGKYYLYSIGAGKYVSSNGRYEVSPATVLTIENVGGDYMWKLCLGGNGMNSQISGQVASGILVNSWTTTDAGNRYMIEEVSIGPKNYTVVVLGTSNAAAGVIFNDKEYKNGESFEGEAYLKKSLLEAKSIDGMIGIVSIDNTKIYVSYFDDDTKFYTIRNGKGGYVSLNPDYMSGSNMLLTNTNTPQDNMGLWAFVEQSSNVYKIYNYSTGLSKAMGINGTEANARTSMVDVESTTHSTMFTGTFNFNSEEPSYIKIYNTNNWWNKRNDYFALWATSSVVGDDGSKFFLTEANYADYPDEYYYEVSEIAGIETYSPKNPNTLWYRTSAEAAGVGNPWMEYALPLGNGELGCMVFGGVHNEEIQFNEKTIWSGTANTIGASSGTRTFMNFGSLIISNLDKAIWDGVTDYVRYLDIEEGVAGVEFKNANGVKQIRKFFSSAPDQVIAGNYTVEGNGKVDLLFKLEPGTGIGAGNVTYENGTASFTGAMTSVNYAARLHVVADKGATITASARGITVNNATEVTFYLKGATNFNGDMEVLDNYFTNDSPSDIDNSIKEHLNEVAAKGYAAVEAAHIEDFTTITKRMTLDLGLNTPKLDTKELVDNYYPNNSNGNSSDNDHLFLEQLYFHFGRYLAISSNRKPIAAPNNLQGIWNNLGSDSPWNSDIHTNINIQMNYWPTEITNLSDLHKPYVNFIIRGAQSAGWKAVGQRYNNGHGWSVLTESSLYNSMSTWGDNYLVANVWYTSHLWTHWRYTQDKEFLKKAFPVMWSAAEFWFHRLIKDRGFSKYGFSADGTYVAPNEFSAEQHGNESEDGTAHAQQMISYLFQNINEAIEILGVEETGLSQAEIEKLKMYLEKTDNGLHTETYTGVWGNPCNGVKTGEEMLREWKYSPYSVGEKGHRHMSHLMALFPMDQITPESKYFTPAVNALKLRGDAATGWSMGWKVNLWARAQDGDHAHIIIKNALKHSTTYGTDQNQGGIYYNLFDSHAPFQIDGNFGVCSGIAEMLMQSAHGYINILPALPAVWKKGGTVKGMKAIGNFTVDFKWDNGKCKSARIVSHAGAELRVRCLLGEVETSKATIKVDGVETGVTVDEHGIVTIPCEKGSVVDIDFTSATSIEPVVENCNRNEGSMYDINGRRISHTNVGQIYIQDGVKKLAK